MAEKDMKRIAILGWYGHHNLGDDAMLRGIIQAVTTLAPCPVEFDVFTNAEGTEYPMFPTIDRIGEINDKYDLLIIGGGDLLRGDVGVFLHYMPERWVEKVTIPIVIYGVGVDLRRTERIDDLKISCSWLLDQGQLGSMWVRDLNSRLQLCELLDVPPSWIGICADPAISLSAYDTDNFDMDDVIRIETDPDAAEDKGWNLPVAEYIRQLHTAKKVYSDRLHGCVMAHVADVPWEYTGTKRKGRAFREMTEKYTRKELLDMSFAPARAIAEMLK